MKLSRDTKAEWNLIVRDAVRHAERGTQDLADVAILEYDEYVQYLESLVEELLKERSDVA